jgi:neural Wiskott-Aldrich syndrome protein
MNDHSAGYTELPRTAYLDHTLRRARTAAEQRSHRYVTPEHLLLALVDDPDAVELLTAVDADIAVIRTSVADIVNHRMSALAVPDGRPPSFSYKFDTLFLTASEDALRAGRREVDGALALIAVAKDPESNASAILAANGFHWHAALNALSAAPASQTASLYRAPPLTPPMRPAQASAPAAPIQSARADASESFMEDMLASVRNILDAEERKERGLPPAGGPAPPPERPAPPRREPQFRAGAGRESMHAAAADRPAVAYPAQDTAGYPLRAEPAVAPAFSSPDRRQPSLARAPAIPEPTTAAFDHETRQPLALDKRRKSRGRSEPPNPLARLLQSIPRKARIGAAEIVQLQLAKEEAGFLLMRAARKGQPQLAPGGHAICRAVTVRLTAPEGGFLIEPSGPETQWILDHPPFHGEEAFGSWAWTVLPNETGSYVLALSVSARDVGENGGLVDLQLPDQFVKARIRGSLGHIVWGFARTLLLLLAGSGLTVGAWYALKIMGKLPH